MKKKSLILLLVLILVFSLASCGNSSENPGEGSSSDSDTIKIGVIGPLTGETAIFGDMLTQTVTLLAEQKNAEGGLLGKQIEVKIYDNRDDTVETTNAARKAIQNDGVCAFIGTDSSSTTIALVDVASENEIPVITSIASNTKVTMTDDGQVRPWAFRACLSDPQSGQILGQYAVNECGYKKIAIIYDIGSDFSIGVTQQFTENVEKSGGEIICTEAYNTGDVDYRAVLTKIKNSGDFDAIYIAAGYYKQIGLIANQARELGIDQPILTTEGAMSQDIFNIAGKSLKGAIFNCTIDLNTDEVDGIRADFKERWGYDPAENLGPDCYLAYDAFTLLTSAIEKAGSSDPSAIRDALESTTSIQGLTCEITFDPETHMVYREVPIIQIGDSEFIQLGLFESHKQ